MTMAPAAVPDAFRQAVAAYENGAFAEAEGLCLVVRGAGHAAALRLLGVIKFRQGDFTAALAWFEEALAVAPEDAAALSGRGAALAALGRREDALASYDRALAIDPTLVEARHRRVVLLCELHRFNEALASLGATLEATPATAQALNRRGAILVELRRFPEALACFEKAQAMAPDDAAAHLDEARLRLLTGDLTWGWPKYEWRWNRGADLRRRFAEPLWDGLGSLYDRTILLHDEPAVEDTIQFCRYAPLVAARGARVILEVAAPLRALMGSLAGVGHLLSGADTARAFDLHCPLGSLPLAFGTTLATIPATTPYLRPPSSALTWDKQLADKPRPRIGLVWAGAAAGPSIPLAALLPLLRPGATFVSLQQDLRAGDADILRERSDILHLGGGLADLSDTAALVSRLDLLITTDGAVAHLAGALGKPVWILLPFTPDWRWLLDRDTSPWYPTARLFRQTRRDDWSDVVARTAAELPRLLAPYGTRSVRNPS